MSYSNDGDNNRIVIISHCNSYLSSYNLEILVFEEVPNYDNYPPSRNLQNSNPKYCSNRKIQILFSENDIFAGLSKLDFYPFFRNL